MPLLRCTSCNRKLNVPDRAVGKKVRCPACKTVFRVPVSVAPAPVVQALEDARPTPARAAVVKPLARPAGPPPEDELEEVSPQPVHRPAARPPAPPPLEDLDFQDPNVRHGVPPRPGPRHAPEP